MEDLRVMFSIIIPILGSAFIAASHKIPNVREIVTLVTAITLFLFNISLLPMVMQGNQPQVALFELFPNIQLLFKVEPLGMMFALIASGLWIINSVYSIGYMRANKEKYQTQFYIFFALAIASTMGLAFAGNLITLFLFYEILTFCTYPLVTHHRTKEAKQGGRIYLGILVGTSVAFFLFAIGWTWQLTGTIDFAQGGILKDAHWETLIPLFLLAFFVFGIGKAAVMPFHKWLPAAMVAPTPVSALLHAVAVVKAGVFSVVKILVYVFGITSFANISGSYWLMLISGFTIIATSIIALRSDNLKRRLAYSTISQLSYVVMASALFTPLAILGAALHILAHAVSKITLFFAAGAIYTSTKKTKVSQLNGIGREMPITMVAFSIGAISLIGIPPAIGFVSKWYILMGALSTGQIFAVVVLILSTILNALYFLPIIYMAFFKNSEGNQKKMDEAPPAILAAMIATSMLCFVLFIFPDIFIQLGSQLAGIQ